MSNISFLENFLKGMKRIQNLLGTVLLVAVTLLVFGQVILRYCLHMPLMGIEELLMLPTIWLYMIGSANASLGRSHIECGIATLYIKTPRGMCIFKIIRNIISVIVGGWLLRWAFWLLQYSFRMGKESPLLFIPMEYVESAVFVGFLLMWLYTVIELIENLTHLLNKNFTSYMREEEI